MTLALTPTKFRRRRKFYGYCFYGYCFYGYYFYGYCFYDYCC
jgi:hypothetical protein